MAGKAFSYFDSDSSEEESPTAKQLRAEKRKDPNTTANAGTVTENENYDDVVKRFRKLATPERNRFKAENFVKISESESAVCTSSLNSEDPADEATTLIPKEILESWQYNPETGDLIPVNPNLPFVRYVPEGFATKSATYACTRYSPPSMQTRALQCFVDGMTQNEQSFKVIIGDRNEKSNTYRSSEVKLLRRILSYDIKKIELKKSVGVKRVTIEVKKMNYDLLPYNNLPGGEPPLHHDGLNTPNLLVEKINENAKYGHYGPGTFWCRKRNCQLRDIVSASSVIDFGGQNKFYATKRSSCSSKDCVYILYCQLCKENGTYACHCGFTEYMQKRVNGHFNRNLSTSTRDGKALPEFDLKGSIRMKEDIMVGNNYVRQDSHCHFAYEHPEGKCAARLAVLEQLTTSSKKEKCDAEEKAKILAGSYNYLGLGRGGLNKRGSS